MEYLIYFLIGIAIIMLISFLLKLSGKILMRLLTNAIIGGIMIFIINHFANPLGINIELTVFSAIIVGMFGVLGVIFLLIAG